ncbi:conserved hypothetical protein [Trichinella spiralis]|uniref:hypothetical protein n=1 Tax=Trichinella spiralis TaxID=6334 RepID=UPI0001EFD05C|nr:conserved hypothetical protein [Trichinella spiralis]
MAPLAETLVHCFYADGTRFAGQLLCVFCNGRQLIPLLCASSHFLPQRLLVDPRRAADEYSEIVYPIQMANDHCRPPNLITTTLPCMLFETPPAFIVHFGFFD